MFSAVWSISMMIVVIVARTIVTVARTILTMMDRRIWVTVGHVVCLGGMQAFGRKMFVAGEPPAGVDEVG